MVRSFLLLPSRVNVNNHFLSPSYLFVIFTATTLANSLFRDRPLWGITFVMTSFACGEMVTALLKKRGIDLDKMIIDMDQALAHEVIKTGTHADASLDARQPF